jgi:hypothetical protein
VIYVTGHLTAAEIDTDYAVRLDPVLPKTISGGELLNAIEKALAAPPSPPSLDSPPR